MPGMTCWQNLHLPPSRCSPLTVRLARSVATRWHFGQLDRFRRGEAVDEETLIRGRRGAYFVNARVALPEGGRKEWSMVAEVDQDAAGVANLVGLFKSARANGSVENHASAGGR